MSVSFIVIVLYLIVLMGVAIYKSRIVKTQDDFMVAGRSVSTWYLVGTLVATWIGSGSLFGGAGLAFRVGFSQLWMSAGAWVGILVVYFLAGKVRRIAQYSVPDILERRYNKWARLLGSTAVIIAYMSIAGYQFRGGGRLLNVVTGIEPFWGALITCGAIVLFTLLAGMVSIVAIDVFNGLLMLFGVALAVPLMLGSVGGLTEVTSSLPADHFEVFGQNNAFWAMGLFFPTFLLLLGESSMYQKFFAAKDEGTARRSVVGMLIGVILIETLLTVVAVVSSSKYFSDPAYYGVQGDQEIVQFHESLKPEHDPSVISPETREQNSRMEAQTEIIILQVAHTELPLFAGTLLLGAALAIIFSTGNTFLMIPSTNVTRDIFQRFINPQASQSTVVRFQRIMIVLLGALAFVLATFFKTILDMAFYAYTMVGAGLTPALLAAFLWKRVTPAGGVASIAAGIVSTILFAAFQEQLHLEFEYIIYPAAISSITALIVVSLATAPSPEDRWRPFMSK
ncbi:MAG: sodium:solute symporter family protein [Bacteroidota bacterium]